MPLWNTFLWQGNYFLNQCVQLIASQGIRSIGNFYLACSSFLEKGQLSGLGSSLSLLAITPLLLWWQTPSSALFLQEGDFCHLLLPMEAASWSAPVWWEQRYCAAVRRRDLKLVLTLWLLRSNLLALPLVKLLNFEWWEVQKAAHFINVQNGSSIITILVRAWIYV